MLEPQTALQTLQASDATLLKYLENIKIESVAQQKNYENIVLALNASIKRVKATLKTITDPIDESKRNTIKIFQPYIDLLENGRTDALAALDAWRKEQSDNIEQKLMTEATTFLQKTQEAKATGEIIPLPTLDATLPPKTSKTEMGSITYADGFNYKIVNPDAVPRDLCVPSPYKIRNRIKSGVTAIEGILITPKYRHITRITKSK